MIFFLISFPYFAFSKGKIYGNSKTISKDYVKYENCRLKQTLLNIKDGEKDGWYSTAVPKQDAKDVKSRMGIGENAPVVPKVVVIGFDDESLITCPALINTLARLAVPWNALLPMVIPLVQSVDSMKVTEVRLEQ